MAWKVKFFQTARKSYPVKEFIEKLDEATYAKVLHSIRLLSNNGPYLKPPYAKKLQNKLYELRIPGKIALRIFFTLYKNEYYLLHAFKKKREKISLRELKTALDRLKEII